MISFIYFNYQRLIFLFIKFLMKTMSLGKNNNLYNVKRVALLGLQKIGKGNLSLSNEDEFKLISQKIKNVNQNSIFVDIGANIGNYTQAIINHYPNQKIYAFEPIKKNIKILNQRFKNTNVEIMPFAVAETNGVATMYADYEGSGLSSLTKRNLDYFGTKFDYQELVKTISFKEFVNNIGQEIEIELVKIDVEGHDLEVLNSFGSFINNVKLIQFEFGSSNIDTRTFFKDFWIFFQLHKFDIYRLTNNRLLKISEYHEQEEYFFYTNYLAVNTFYEKD